MWAQLIGASLALSAQQGLAQSGIEDPYYLDPPSPPYCTPYYAGTGCIPFGGWSSPSDLPLPPPRSVELDYDWLLVPVELVYSSEAQAMGREGVVDLALKVDVAGEIVDLRVLTSDDSHLELLVLSAVERFQPAPERPGEHRIRIRFALER